MTLQSLVAFGEAYNSIQVKGDALNDELGKLNRQMKYFEDALERAEVLDDPQGRQEAVTAHMGTLSYHLGRKVVWDETNNKIIDA